MRSDKHSGKKKRKWPKVVGIIMLLLVLGGGVYAYTIWNSLNDAVGAMHDPVKREKSEKRAEKVTFKEKDPFSVLLLGTDGSFERKGDVGRSDSMIVLTVNPNEKSVKMLSIPRDTRTEIVDKGTVDKINHAYAFGSAKGGPSEGAEWAMNTVENMLDIPIDYYATINMDGFKDIVNAVGGVTVNNDLDFTYQGIHFPKGQVELDGKKALAFSRMRYEDPRGDFGRQLRQRDIIQGVIREGASLSSLWNFDDIFDALGKNVKTNLSFKEMVDIQKNYKDAAGKIEQIDIKTGQGSKIDGVYYYIIPDAELGEIQSTLKKHLQI
ncbi:LytR family transcriptional regulator [Rossellomorea marisflavi]|uniref:LCP family glycopolymer transferase n=1 Tax=Rossellomorea marisflavi TaxID=189381 RepID=UPI00207AE41C|nr:LytR family transcriptional regulator [Rossellomorea marisflavi]USK91811.1 LytR family transcriptional regulator [Rossellomorea marisflavi]